MATPQQVVEDQIEEELSPEEEERALFEEEIQNDPDLADEAPEPKAEEEPEPDEEEAPTEKGEQAKEEPPKTPTGLEWLELLPEDKRAEAQNFIGRQGQTIARLDQRVNSHLGQLRPAQRAVSQMQRKLRELEQQVAQQQQNSLPPTVEEQRKAYDAWADEEYKDFPEEAAKLKARFRESLDGALSGLPKAQPAAQQSAPVGPDRSQEIQHLATAYSDWGERRYSPEFDAWLKRQPREIVELLNSPFAADNVALLDSFTRDNPEWQPPQTPDEFHSLAQAQHSPLYRGWAEAEGINPDMNLAQVPDFQRDAILTRFKQDLGAVYGEVEQADNKEQKLRQRRSQQLRNRDPGSRRVGVTPGQPIDLNSEEGQRAYFNQLIAADPDLK